jgi:ATP-dependent DNA helicase PIF1
MKYIEQDSETALNLIKKSNNCFLTGPPGSGKSHIIREYIKYCKSEYINVGITASTGIAAKIIEGYTIHSWSGIEIVDMKDTYDDVLKRVINKPNIVKRWRIVNVLIIDEISLLDCKVFDFLNRIGKHIRNNTKPFGGIKLLIVGDFYQLPPVCGDFCFNSNDWNNIFEYSINLTSSYRSNDIKLTKILRTIRKAKPLKKNMIKALESRILDTQEDGTINWVYPVLVPLRETARNINQNKLNENTNKEYIYNAMFSTQCNNSVIKKMVLNMSPMEGCSVVNIVNDNIRGLMNGMVGSIVDFVNDKPVVNFEGKVYIMDYHVWTKTTDNNEMVFMKQIPLLIAYALTIHRCQGMTLNQASIILDKNIFECGQAYVALSRLKSLDNMYLTGNDMTINPNVFMVNQKVKDYYINLISYLI